MIGFNRLGLLGRLGNQMFQYASLRGIAAKNGYNFMILPQQNLTRRWMSGDIIKFFIHSLWKHFRI